MVAPEGPFGGAIGEAVLDDQPDGGVDDPSGVMAAGGGQVGGVGVEVLAAGAAIVLRAEQDDVAGPLGEGVAQVVEGAADEPIAVGAVPAMRARAPAVVAAADADVGLGQILGTSDAESRVGAIFAGSGHEVPPGRWALPGDTLDDGEVFTESARFPCYRLFFFVYFVYFVVKADERK
jgi:hypothetical protein